MSMVKVLVRAGLLRLYARIFYRKVQLRLLCRIAHKRIGEVESLANFVGLVFKEGTPLFSAVHWITLKNMGYATNADGQRIVPLCWNAPIAIVVYLEELPCLGLGVEFRGRALCIRQMQGVRGAMLLRNVRDWPELLVKTCMAYAEENGLKEVRVYKADQEFGFEHPEIEPEGEQQRTEVIKAHQDRMRRRYDRTAQKLKFKKKKRYYVWKVPPQAQPY